MILLWGENFTLYSHIMIEFPSFCLCFTCSPINTLLFIYLLMPSLLVGHQSGQKNEHNSNSKHQVKEYFYH